MSEANGVASKRVLPDFSYFAERVAPDDLRRLAHDAEAAGVGTLWGHEESYDSSVYNQLVASATERVRYGTSIARFYKRHPLLVAETAAALDRLAPGRLIIGVGTGAAQRADPSLKPQRWGTGSNDPVGRLSEYIEIVRRVLTGDEVTFEGKYYAFEQMKLDLVPSTRPPIFLAAGGPKLSRLAAQQADGIFVSWRNDRLMRERIDSVRDEAQAAGRSPSEISFSRTVVTSIHPDYATARRAFREYLRSLYLPLAWVHDLIAANGFPEHAERIRGLVVAGDVDEASKVVPDEFIDAFGLAGDPESCAERLEQLLTSDLGVPKLSSVPVDGDWLGAYRRTIQLVRMVNA